MVCRPSLWRFVELGKPPPPLKSPSVASPSLSSSAVFLLRPTRLFHRHSPCPRPLSSSPLVPGSALRSGSITHIRMVSTTLPRLPRLPVFEAISNHDPGSTVVVHSASQRTFKYGELLGDVCRTRDQLLEATGKSDINGERVAFLVENSYDYVGE